MKIRSVLATLFSTAVVATGLHLATVTSSLADDRTVETKAVVELFTSQGCVSCPPADAIISELVERGDLVALAYHVDYWDYIGWADTFADQAYSNYQRSYARNWGKNRIYTPQLVVNGVVDVVGSRRDEVESAVAEAELVLPVSLHYADGVLAIDIEGNEELQESVVWLVTFRSSAQVAIDRGENRGKTVEYTQIVTSRQILGMWEPSRGVQLKMPLIDILGDDSDGVAVIVQSQQNSLPGPILGAAAFEM